MRRETADFPGILKKACENRAFSGRMGAIRKNGPKIKNNNIISAIHYGHFDFCLDNRIWPFSDPYHKEYWELVFPLIKLVIKYQKKFVHTPFPLIQNPYLFWSSANYILKEFKEVKLSMSLVNYDLRFIHRPKSIKSLRLKKMSNNKNYKMREYSQINTQP